MPARNRPAKRVLNRWCDNLDKGVLLCIQYACAEAGLKIPWGRVAALMGPTFTEGSIVQHLAKLRNLMAKAGIPVPPAVKRGMVTKEPSKIYATTAANNVKLEEVAPMFPEAPSIKEEGDGEDKGSIYDKPKRVRKKKEVPAVNEAGPPVKKEPKSKGRGKGKAKGRRHHANDEEDDNEPIPDLYDSDDEYPPPKKRRHNGGQSKKKDTFAEASPGTPDGTISSVVPPTETADAHKDVEIKLEEEELAGPARRTRGIKRDYSAIAGGSDDEAELDEEVPQQMDEGFEGTYGDIGDDDENVPGDGIDDDMDEASSEVSTIVFGRQRAISRPDSHALPRGNVTELPYGQIISTTDAHPTMPTFAHFNTPIAGIYGRHGHMGVGTINPYAVSDFGYPGAATMTTMPQAYPASRFPSMSLYNSSTDSSRNNSIGADMMFQTLPSMSEDEFLTAHTGFGYNTGDVIGEEDMMNSTPNDEIFWGESNYLVDDA